jgi:hypothetical protein
MKYKIELLIVASVLFCLVLVQAAPAANTIKTLYVDGVEVNQVSDANAGLTWPLDRITIGSEGNKWYIDNEYLGKMDEFAVYAGVMSPTRIKAHYDANQNYTNYKNAVQADAPLLWLKFEDASTANGQTATNSGSKTARNGQYIVNGSGSIAKVTGMNSESNGIEFVGPRTSGGTGSCVDVWDAGEFSTDINGDVTIELWVNFQDTNDYPRFFQHNGNWQALGGYGVAVSGPNQLVVIGGGTSTYVTRPPGSYLDDGQWHQIVVTYDSTYDPPNLPPAGAYVEEVNKDNPVLWLRFEDTQPKDYSAADGNHWVGYGAGLSIVNKVGGIGKSAYLDGSSYAAATNNPNSPPAVNDSYEIFDNNYAFAPNDITFEIWYKAGPQSDYAYFFQQVGSSGTEPCAPAVGNCTGQIRIWGGGSPAPWYTNVNPKFDQQWHQLVVTYDEKYSNGDANMFVQLYLDGALQGTKLFTGANAKLGPELSHIMVGARNDIGSVYNTFTGYVDEFAIYAGILDPNRVLIHYSAWQPHNCAELMNKEPALAGDIDNDCHVDFGDFAELALDWRRCNEPNKPGCSPNW